MVVPKPINYNSENVAKNLDGKPSGDLVDLKKVRMREHSGIVTNDAGVTQFSFIISPLKNRAEIEKNDYIALDHPKLGDNCPVIAVVKDIKSYENVAGQTLRERVGKLMATAEIIGYVNLRDNSNQLQTLLVPPSAGSRVYMLYSEFVQELYTTDIHGEPFSHPLYIGKTELTAINQKEDNKRLNFYLDPQTVTKGHTLITALDNSGKTHIAKVIIEELINKTEQTVVVFDPYKEYKTIVTYKKQEQQINDNTATKIAQKQLTILTTKKGAAKNKISAYSQTLLAIWKARLEGTLPPLTVVIENAEAIDQAILEQVVYEGTKYGIALILVSKQPTQLNKNVIFQMNSQIIGKTIDYDYLKYLSNMLLPSQVEEITKLKQRQWIVNTDGQQQITKITAKNGLE
jgi:hypothetical protein